MRLSAEICLGVRVVLLDPVNGPPARSDSSDLAVVANNGINVDIPSSNNKNSFMALGSEFDPRCGSVLDKKVLYRATYRAGRACMSSQLTCIAPHHASLLEKKKKMK